MKTKVKRAICILLSVTITLSLSSFGLVAEGTSGPPDGGGGGGSSATVCTNRPVFRSSVYEMPDADATEATFTLYGYYGSTADVTDEETGEVTEEACTLHAFTEYAQVAIYTDSDATASASDVTAAFDGSTLTLTYDTAPTDETYYYVVFTDGETECCAVPIYVVSYISTDTYLTDTADYSGYTLRYNSDVYTPGSEYYEDGDTGSIIGGANDLFSAADFADEIQAAAESYGYDYSTLYKAVDWYMNNGATTGGDTWTEFCTDRSVDVNPTDDGGVNEAGAGYLRVESCYYLFRYYWMNNNMYETSTTGIFTDNMNKLADPWFWGNYYCTWFQALNPALRAGGLFQWDSLVDPDGTNTNEAGMFTRQDLAYGIDETINYGDFLNMIYNAITGGQAALNDAGDTAWSDLETLAASYGGENRANNAKAVATYFGMDFITDLESVMEQTVTKWDAVMMYYCLKGTSDATKEIPDENTEDIYGYNTTKIGDLALDTYEDEDQSNTYGLTMMGAVTISPSTTVDEDDWDGCTIYTAGSYSIIFDNTATVDPVLTDTSADSGTVYYTTLSYAEEPLAFSYSLAKDGDLVITGVDGYDAFASGTDQNNADTASFYCSGLWVRDGAQVTMKNVTILPQASSSSSDVSEDSHRFFGGGAGLQVTDNGTLVTVENDDGQAAMIGTGSTSAGSLYAGTGASMSVSNSTLVNATGHPYCVMYNGIMAFDNDTLMNSGRIFSSDAGSGTVIMNDVVAQESSGDCIEDETCSFYATNSFITKLGESGMNGNSQAVFVNTTVENGGSWTFANKTSMATDVGEVIFLNSTLENTSGSIFSSDRGGRGKVLVEDSVINWSGDADTTLLTVKGPNTWLGGELYVEADADSVFPTDFSVVVAGDCISATNGWIEDETSYESNSVLYLDIDQVIHVSMDCSATTSCSNSMFGLTDIYTNTGNVVFVVDGEYIYTGLDENGDWYHADLAELTSDGDMVYTLPNGSTMTYENADLSLVVPVFESTQAALSSDNTATLTYSGLKLSDGSIISCSDDPSVTVYTDENAETLAAGVTGTASNGTLTLTFETAPTESTTYYISMDGSGVQAVTILVEADDSGGTGGDTSTTYTKLKAPWVYSYTETNGVAGDATITFAQSAVKSYTVTLIPASLNGIAVTTFGNSTTNVMTNNKTNANYVIFADGIKTISSSAIYDYNNTSAWVIPSSVTTIGSLAFSSCSGSFYTTANSAAASYAAAEDRTVVELSDSNTQTFTVSAGENGTITPNGTYHLPKTMLNGGYSTEFIISASENYKIKSITVDGAEVDLGTKMVQDSELNYAFSDASTAISVEFEALAEGEEETRSFDDDSYVYEAPEIVDGAVADGTQLPDDVNTYVAMDDTATDYAHTMGISTGSYYVYNGTLYEMVYSSQNTSTVEYHSKAEVINALYQNKGMVYGTDYDLIRLYNYSQTITSGPSQGTVTLYCTYAYKSSDPQSLDDVSSVVSSTNTDTANIFVQGAGTFTASNFTAYGYTGARGPSEAGNFYGMGSSILVDGGTNAKIKSGSVLSDTAILVLNSPQVLGTVNSLYATAQGIIYMEGGNVFSCSSGGHGPYVSLGGQIIINTEGTNLINSDGSVNIDDPIATEIPSSDLGAMTRNEEDSMEGVYADHADDVTVVVTGDEAGTALATDSGGGLIVANQTVTKTYGLRCAGVYSIGYSESWVYCFNSSLTSYLDAGLCSASAGYIYAHNCEINGVMGLKTRASGSASTTDAGIWVENSRVAASYNAEDLEYAYDVGSPDEMIDAYGEAAGVADSDTLTEAAAKIETYIDENGLISNQLNIFADKANSPSFAAESLTWWYVDRSKTPGYSGGNKFSVIYVDASPAVMNVTASMLTNDNYTDYGSESDWWNSLTEDEQTYYTPADNLLISVENGGTGNITFNDENSATVWDVLGNSTETTELSGDFYLGGPASGSEPGVQQGATNTLNATFNDSEWSGTILYGDDEMSGTVHLTFDGASSWTVTDTCYLTSLTLAEGATVSAPAGQTVTMTVDGVSTAIGEGTYSGKIVLSVSSATLVTSIAVTGEDGAVSVQKGDTLQMVATVLPATAADSSITWSVANGTGSATIDSSTGLLTAVSKGTVTVTATAKDGSGVTGSAIITITASSSSSSKTYYTVTAKAGEGGSISLSSSRVVKNGSVTITVTAKDGYEISDVLVNNVSVGAVSSYTIKNITSNTTVKAVFEKSADTSDTPWTNPFSDVSQDMWYYDAVKFVSENELMNGVGNGKFDPGGSMTRAMFVTVLYRMSDENTVEDASVFSDVSPNAWYGNAVSWAYANGIVNGYGNGLFGPDTAVTREQLVVMLYHFANYMDFDITASSSMEDFTDTDDISSWASDAMSWAVGVGILSGDDNHHLNPQATATRAENATILKNLIQILMS